MANGDSPTFLAKGEFKKSVGQDITYEKNEKYNTAKMIQDTPQFQPKPQQKEDVQTYIIRQSMLKAAVDYHAGHPVDVNDVMETARVFINFVNNG